MFYSDILFKKKGALAVVWSLCTAHPEQTVPERVTHVRLLLCRLAGTTPKKVNKRMVSKCCIKTQW